jgi:hypothetical protein
MIRSSRNKSINQRSFSTTVIDSNSISSNSSKIFQNSDTNSFVIEDQIQISKTINPNQDTINMVSKIQQNHIEPDSLSTTFKKGEGYF